MCQGLIALRQLHMGLREIGAQRCLGAFRLLPGFRGQREIMDLLSGSGQIFHAGRIRRDSWSGKLVLLPTPPSSALNSTAGAALTDQSFAFSALEVRSLRLAAIALASPSVRYAPITLGIPVGPVEIT